MAASAIEIVQHRISLPTGLDHAEVRALRHAEKIAIAAWHDEVAGDDNGRPWLPAAIRRLGVDAQLHLAQTIGEHILWTAREKHRCAANVEYFTRWYGHVRTGSDDDPGPPIPFDLWDEQAEILAIFDEEDRIVILKARQLGLTWLALHYGHHLIALEPAGRNAVVLGLSQDGGYAKRLLERARNINNLTPGYLRVVEARDTRGSKTEVKYQGRGQMISLPGTPAAPRSFQADLAICDEWAFVRNGQAGPTMRALQPAARKIIAISSGDGGPDEPGNGKHFATLYTRAREGQNEWTACFLPTSTHPSRTPAWREAERGNYDTDEEFFSEHPETDDEALIGSGKDRYFTLGQISAAILLGGELDKLLGTDDMPPPQGGALALGIDWGENGVALPIWPLERGGIYVPPGETYGAGVEPGEQTVAMHHAIGELQDVSRETGLIEPPVGEARYDAAGAQSMRTFKATARARFSHQYVDQLVRTRKVPFSKYKTETGKYLKRVFKRTGNGMTTGVIAISPTNTELIRQLRALESGTGGIWKKALDQDGPDALIAGVQIIARQHRELKE